MLSQDNSPHQTKTTRVSLRFIVGGISAFTLACFGLLATTTQLQWSLPSIAEEDGAPVTTASVNTQKITPRASVAKETIFATRLTAKTAAKAGHPVSISGTGTSEAAINVNIKSVELNAPTIALPKASPRRPVQQPGDDIVIKQLKSDQRIPVNSSGMPVFYKTVLEPTGRMTEHGLMQFQARANFGYDHQDIFTGEVPDGAYVIHCQKPEIKLVRAMCWRELQISNDQWVQYRFPRSRMKDWWKIEQKVLANTG